MHIKFSQVKDHLEDLGIDRMTVLARILWTKVGRVWSGFVWLKIWTNGEVL
jgi:hypothetical protein